MDNGGGEDKTPTLIERVGTYGLQGMEMRICDKGITLLHS